MQPRQTHDCIFFCTMNIHRQNHPITYKKHRLAQQCENSHNSVKIRVKTH